MRDYSITYTILLATILLILITMFTAPALLGNHHPSGISIASGVHITLALASAAAVGMTLWFMFIGKLLRRWLPGSFMSPHAITLLMLSTCVIFLATGAELFILRTIAMPPALSLLLNVLRITPVLLLLTYVMPTPAKAHAI